MPKYSYFLIALILMLVPLYPKFPLLGISGTFVSVRLEDFVLAAIFLFWLVSRIKSLRELAHLPTHRAILLYLGVGVTALFSGIFLTKTASTSLGLLHWIRRVEYMAVFFVAFDFLKSRAQLFFLTRTLILVSLLVGLYGLGQQFLGLPVISTTNTEFAKGLALSLGPGARINPTFAGHYDLAAYSVFPLLLILGLLILPGTKFKFLLIANGLVIYWSLLLSASRVTFAAFFLTAGLFILVMRKYFWLAPLAVIAVISILVTPQLLGRYREFVINHLITGVPSAHAQAVDEETADALKPPSVPEDRSLNIRLKAEWPRALRSFWKNPVFGTGFSSVGLATDNDYLRSLAETGALGFAALGLIILRFLKSSFRYLISPPQTFESVFIASITFGLVGLLLNAVFIDVFEASKVAIVTWTLLGLAEKTKTLI